MDEEIMSAVARLECKRKEWHSCSTHDYWYPFLLPINLNWQSAMGWPWNSELQQEDSLSEHRKIVEKTCIQNHPKRMDMRTKDVRHLLTKLVAGLDYRNSEV
jgi:hypothetical protein